MAGATETYSRTMKWPKEGANQHDIEVSMLFRSSEFSSGQQDDPDTATLYFLVRGALDENEAVAVVAHRDMASGKVPAVDDHQDYTSAEELEEEVEPAGGFVEMLGDDTTTIRKSTSSGTSSGGATSGGTTSGSVTVISGGGTIKVFPAEDENNLTDGTGIVPWKYNDALPRRNIKIEERIDNTTWVVAVAYSSSTFSGHDSENNRDADQFTFEVSTIDKHIVRGIKTTDLVSSEKSDNFINDGRGVDIKMPCASFSETHEFSDAKFKRSVRNTILATVGKINVKKFRGLAAKEVLFVSASGSRHGKSASDKWQVTFNFAIQKTETVPSMKVHTANNGVKTLNSFKKPGWDYLWFRLREVKSVQLDKTKTNMENAVRTEVQVYGVFVSQVYQTADFSALRI
jgi:hypothetical protein